MGLGKSKSQGTHANCRCSTHAVRSRNQTDFAGGSGHAVGEFAPASNLPDAQAVKSLRALVRTPQVHLLETNSNHLQTGGGQCIRYTQPSGGYCLKALRVKSRTRLAFAPGDARYATP